MHVLSHFRFRTDRPVEVRSVRQAKAVLAVAADLETSGEGRDRAWANRCYRAVEDFLARDRRGARTARRTSLLEAARAGIARTGQARRAVFESLIRAEPLEVSDLEQALDDTTVDLQAALGQYRRDGSASALADVPSLALRLEALSGALASARAAAHTEADDEPTPWPLAA